ncbi:beta-1,3-galactosyl-O-glycosyl-glycoprotein beta-1,6-N-acetylglucosaminyltransferase 3-like [Physella acuta]|uniref:beta-1,3-galactosyl-O-glycosyl-glycoprotein beta-1,6-N-acetylglucosaminyltransferase 3-like n=1 Tax=Physella acuta TaxID=109671 RepID=UPI0027DD8DF9|nr:beta-1,3-galactosyl-O-glycosyl-glycoprotein beta-1,6-N-acetylglucosaminyltransferase 3-like [Physella acuta]XP_059145300.1 beta-1,3-galactosyl-O-glycosyl-glycoprotein beta-1,6-N-acetylglucosaminyltransferase 3-like [Physella acuta]XP_059145301.1 beta-1,3-galactosyl-O-glycosyl-glycoprotein beta-1,6-N-acetylglucosaminyltransferase 3-like [Physella acuta]
MKFSEDRSKDKKVFTMLYKKFRYKIFFIFCVGLVLVYILQDKTPLLQALTHPTYATNTTHQLDANTQLQHIDTNTPKTDNAEAYTLDVIVQALTKMDHQPASNVEVAPPQNHASGPTNACMQTPEKLARLLKVKEIDCKSVFSGSKSAVDEGISKSKSTKRELLSNDFYLNLTENCENFKAVRGYMTCPLSSEEEEFPLAYSIVAYKDIEMVERLLRAIYRPQNYYCFHLDAKSDKTFYLAMSAIAQCFPNVFLSADRVDIKWGEFSVLEAEIVCMRQLWRYTKWKYFINLTGQEFPLKTNAQIVKILHAYNGANDLEGTVKRANKDRWNNKTPPRGLRPVKGSVHVIANRDFVDYILHNDTAKELLEWVRGTGIPDETFFATLNHNPQLGIRGSYKGDPETESADSLVKPFLTRFKNWGSEPFKANCAGNFVRGICILSTGDLPQLGTAKQLFANKFYLWEDFTVIGCLEEKLMNATRDELLGLQTFNVTHYAQLGFVKNQVT